MSEKKGIFRFLNLFDIVLIAVIVILAAVLVFVGGTGESSAVSENGTVTYVIEFKKMENGSENLIQVGDKLVDKIKKDEIGTVKSVEIKDAADLEDNMLEGGAADAVYENGKDVLVTIEAPCTENDRSITVGGGYVIRIGREASVRGPGYFGAGYIVDVERSDG